MSGREALTPRARAAAFYEATGMKPKEVAEKLDLVIGTIHNWHMDPAYLAERDAWIEKAVSKLEPLIARVRVAAILEHERALEAQKAVVETLLEALEAKVPDSDIPLWPVRIAAAKELAKVVSAPSPLIAALVKAEAETKQAQIGGVVKLEITYADGHPSQEATVTAEEVIEDGSWEAHQTGDGAAEAPALPAAGETGAAVVPFDADDADPDEGAGSGVVDLAAAAQEHFGAE